MSAKYWLIFYCVKGYYAIYAGGYDVWEEVMMCKSQALICGRR